MTSAMLLGILSGHTTGHAYDLAEVCNGLDDDGDGLVDEGPVAWAVDADGDGAGDERDVILTEGCGVVPANRVADVSDCDDGSPQIGPGARETCNGIDDDCDGQVDAWGVCPCDAYTGNEGTWLGCSQQETWVGASGECASMGYHLASVGESYDVYAAGYVVVASNLGDAWIGLSDRDTEGVWAWEDGTPYGYTNWAPGQPSNTSDVEDCVIIEPSSGEWVVHNCTDQMSYVCQVGCTPQTWYDDRDGDGLGTAAWTVSACSAPWGFAGNALDCDDDDSSLPAVLYEDLDGDGYGGALVIACAGVATPGDCNDGDPSVSPGRPELPGDGIDNDCNGFVDDSGPGTTTGTTSGTNPTGTSSTGSSTGTNPTGTNPTGSTDPGTDGTDAPAATDDGAGRIVSPPEPDLGFGLGCGTTGGPLGSWLAVAAAAALGRRRRISSAVPSGR